MSGVVLTAKQSKALDILDDRTTVELLYGGAAGGAKSFLGCYWQLKRRWKYPNTKGLIGRAHLKTLKDTTLKTMLDVQNRMGLIRGTHWDLTGSNDKENPNSLVYSNGSVILLRDLFAYPSDPDIDELGSLEITDAFVDECGQVIDKVRQTLMTRIRYRLDEYDLIPKILYSSNPTKGWAYNDFYLPHREGRLRDNRKYLAAYVTDNPYAPKVYIDLLDNMPDGAQKQRLRYGNWEYDDDPTSLIEYENIVRAFGGSGQAGLKYISCDYARYGSDTPVIGVWNGYRVKLYQYKGLSTVAAAEEIKRLQRVHGIASNSVVVDEDGVGGGVVDILRCKGFVNNSRAIDENFDNLKSQCYFKLADAINEGKVFIDGGDYKDKIIQELEQVKQKSVDATQKKGIVSKDVMKEQLGRSPDFSDCLAMRFYFDVGVPKGVVRAKGFT